MKYRNKKTGIIFSTNGLVFGANIEPIEETEEKETTQDDAAAEEKPKKKRTKKK